MLAAFVSFLDRQILTLLVAPIEADLKISDTQIGVLQGFSFAVFFSVMAVPLGWLVDRFHRWRVLAVGVALWSLATIASGLAQSYHQLLAARMMIGIGEASLMPAAYSLLSDYFSPEARGRAFGVFSLSSFAGGGGSLLLGGIVLHALGAAASVTLPGFGQVPVWRATFVIVGIPGLIVATVLATRHDPPRGSRGDSPGSSGAIAFLRYVRQHLGTFTLVWAAYTLLVFAGYTFIPWAPVHFGRRFGLTPGSVGTLVGTLQVVSGGAGALLAGWLADRWTHQSRKGAKFRVSMIMWLGGLPSLVLFSLTDNFSLAIIGFTAFTLCDTVGYVSAAAAIQDMVPSEFRGLTTASWYLVTGVIGIGGGPVATALLSTHLSQRGDQLGPAMLLAAAPAMLLGLIVTLAGLRPYDALRALRSRSP